VGSAAHACREGAARAQMLLGRGKADPEIRNGHGDAALHMVGVRVLGCNVAALHQFVFACARMTGNPYSWHGICACSASLTPFLRMAVPGC